MSGLGAVVGLVLGGVGGALIGNGVGNLSPAAGTDAEPGLAGLGAGLLLGGALGAFFGGRMGGAKANPPSELPRATHRRRRLRR
jgi:hypothetical protein